ncbi:hypothetical protein [Allomuricauda sp. SCSIO 65647]|uniref:hypothetical protein n=1 Tax=Allomuricauda sp. SCSIO 65647 TaxID=2908843 RepID=UPI001F17CF46|nr:hypothetical protein [Muricauda sp. SCSIO 65647]UJH67953.1 hypothetical protein L0P89_01730 [Muricauda sp. SCSIO 65647]
MKLLSSILICSICLTTVAQKTTPYTKVDSSNFKKIYPYALRGDMNAVFEILEKTEDRSLTQRQRDKKNRYYQRFLYRNEDFDFNTDDTEIVDLFKRFQNYWRSVIIENVTQDLADSLFRGEMTYFLKKYHRPELSVGEIKENYYSLFQGFFRSKNIYGIGVGKTGHLYDLYLWKDQEEIDYSINLPEGQTIKVPVVFMRDFISNGWSHYTTFGHSFSGGWAMADKLFCVEESYGPKDEEEFLISYVSHEGQHFSDYKSFPKLKQADLEYRAKLTELSLAKETTHQIVDKFITNAKNDVSYAHAFANYTVIRLLSERIFGSGFESNLEKWKQIPTKKINKASLKLLKEHSRKLKSLGAGSIEEYITTL